MLFPIAIRMKIAIQVYVLFYISITLFLNIFFRMFTESLIFFVLSIIAGTITAYFYSKHVMKKHETIIGARPLF